MLETVREANKIINTFGGEREIYNVDLFMFLQEAYRRNDFHATQTRGGGFESPAFLSV
jgi:hypothetical protein